MARVRYAKTVMPGSESNPEKLGRELLRYWSELEDDFCQPILQNHSLFRRDLCKRQTHSETEVGIHHFRLSFEGALIAHNPQFHDGAVGKRIQGVHITPA